MVVGPNYGQKNGVWLEQPILTAGKVLKAGGDNLPIDATNTDTDVADAVTKKHDRQHTVTEAADHVFPGGSTNFLREDGSWQPPGGGSCQVPTHEATYDHPDLVSKKHSNTLDHARQHSVTDLADHTFPGGSTEYLRKDGTWAVPPGAGSESEAIVVATQDTPNATTSLIDAVGLSFNADASSTYIIEAFIRYATSATTVGIQLSATASGTPTATLGHFIGDAANGTPDSSSYNANDVKATLSAAPFTTDCMAHMHAILKTSGSASVWKLRFCAETTGTVTVKIGTTLRYRKVA